MENKNKEINGSKFIPSLEQSKRQIEHYNLDLDAQSILVASRLMATSSKLGLAAEIHFSKFGLSTGRYRLLADLEDNGGKELPSQLAEHLDVTRATVTGLIGILKRDGLVSRESSAEDGRQKLVTLTEKGRSKLIEMAPEHFDWLESIVSLLTIEERTVFLNLLGRVTQRISVFVEQSDQLKDTKE